MSSNTMQGMLTVSMVVNVISWNVRGACHRDKRAKIRRVLNKYKADVVILQETKKFDWSDSDILQVWGQKEVQWLNFPAYGRSGGMLLLWDPQVCMLEDSLSGDYTISASLRNRSDGFLWGFSGVYGPNSSSGKKRLWRELDYVHGLWDFSWCIAGDFNAVRFSNERRGGCRVNRDMRRFSAFIDRNDLVDLPLLGASFTWSNRNDEAPRMSRIDRFLLSPCFESYQSGCTQAILPCGVSDHFPIFLSCPKEDWGAKPFRFELMWLQEPSFGPMVMEWWNSFVFEGNAGFTLHSKLRALKGKLKCWNHEVVGKIESKIDSLSKEIMQLTLREETSDLSEEDMARRRQAREDLDKYTLMEEIKWRQRSRINWLKAGDRNTKFFHCMATAKKRRNGLSHLMVDGNMVSDKGEICDIVIAFYDKLYSSSSGSSRPILDGLAFKQLAVPLSIGLESSILEEEVWEALKSMGRDKAPGPDGFPLEFFLFSWDVVKEDIMKVITDFDNFGFLDWRLNTTFLALLPKKDDVESMKDFRPISLIGTIFKLISKVLADRLKKVISPLISTNQGAFIHGRQILDGVLLANELIYSRIKAKENGILCKIDIEKAYDHVDWNFLDYVLSRMGFGSKWRFWVKTCIATASFSVLVNGSPKGFFKSSRGLRQGDPLSPFLFLMVMEGLNLLLHRAKDLSWIKGFKAHRMGTMVTHLHFADDTLVFLEANQEQVEKLRLVLTCFELVSGLHINLAKSKIFAVGEVGNLDELAAGLGCEVLSLPSSYLGLPLGAKSTGVVKWDPIVERFERKLASWKKPLLSKGARVTLIQSVLSNLPVYFLSLFAIPISVAKRLERIMRNFLWEKKDGSQNYHLVKWDTITRSKLDGGLGIRNIKEMNKALLGKWHWRFGLDDDMLWKKIIIEKYGRGNSCWVSKFPKDPHGVGLWRSISNNWHQFSEGIRFEVHNGDSVSFWLDRWLLDEPLRTDFPCLFELTRYKENKVSSMCRPGIGSGWDLGLNRRIPDAALDEVARLLHILNQVHLDTDADRRFWRWEEKGTFSVKSLYEHFRKVEVAPFPTKFIWSALHPPRVSFFTWCVSHSKILSIENLQKRGWFLTNRCYLCMKNLETVDHLLIHCEFTRFCWDTFLLKFGIAIAAPGTCLELLKSWSSAPLKKRGKILWNLLPAAIWWNIWAERNNRAFNNKAKTKQQVNLDIIASLINWSSTSKSMGGIRLESVISQWENFQFDPG